MILFLLESFPHILRQLKSRERSIRNRQKFSDFDVLSTLILLMAISFSGSISSFEKLYFKTKSLTDFTILGSCWDPRDRLLVTSEWY